MPSRPSQMACLFSVRKVSPSILCSNYLCCFISLITHQLLKKKMSDIFIAEQGSENSSAWSFEYLRVFLMTGLWCGLSKWIFRGSHFLWEVIFSQLSIFFMHEVGISRYYLSAQATIAFEEYLFYISLWSGNRVVRFKMNGLNCRALTWFNLGKSFAFFDFDLFSVVQSLK